MNKLKLIPMITFALLLQGCTKKAPSYVAPPGPVVVNDFRIFGKDDGLTGSKGFTGRIDPEDLTIQVQNIKTSFAGLAPILKDNIKKRKIIRAIVSVDDQKKLNYLELTWLGGDPSVYPYFKVFFEFEGGGGAPVYKVKKWRVNCPEGTGLKCADPKYQGVGQFNVMMENTLGSPSDARLQLSSLLDALI